MPAYMVSYDLHKQGQNYDCLHKKLKAYGTHWHFQQSVWLVETTQSAAQIRDSLVECLDHNDKLLVAKLDGEAAWYGYSVEVSQWLKSRLTPTLHC
jgi:CRISPR/Cas system-associated endoribonuclease Cas2